MGEKNLWKKNSKVHTNKYEFWNTNTNFKQFSQICIDFNHKAFANPHSQFSPLRNIQTQRSKKKKTIATNSTTSQRVLFSRILAKINTTIHTPKTKKKSHVGIETVKRTHKKWRELWVSKQVKPFRIETNQSHAPNLEPFSTFDPPNKYFRESCAKLELLERKTPIFRKGYPRLRRKGEPFCRAGKTSAQNWN